MDHDVYQETRDNTQEKTARRDRVEVKFREAERLVALTAAGREAYKRLSVLRARLARDAGVPAYQVLSNKLLLSLAELLPRDEAGLGAVDGLGVTRQKAYGAEVLAVLRIVQPPASTEEAAVS